MSYFSTFSFMIQNIIQFFCVIYIVTVKKKHFYIFHSDERIPVHKFVQIRSRHSDAFTKIRGITFRPPLLAEFTVRQWEYLDVVNGNL